MSVLTCLGLALIVLACGFVVGMVVMAALEDADDRRARPSKHYR